MNRLEGTTVHIWHSRPEIYVRIVDIHLHTMASAVGWGGRVQRRCCGRLLCRGVLCGSAFEKLRVMRGGLVTHNYAELWIWGVWYCCWWWWWWGRELCLTHDGRSIDDSAIAGLSAGLVDWTCCSCANTNEEMLFLAPVSSIHGFSPSLLLYLYNFVLSIYFSFIALFF